MPKRIKIAAHLSVSQLHSKYREAKNPVARSQYQILWLLASGKKTEEVAIATGYLVQWIRKLAGRYNSMGVEGRLRSQTKQPRRQTPFRRNSNGSIITSDTTASSRWRVAQYWGQLNFDRPLDRWVFGSKQTGAYLLKFRWFSIQRHILVKGYASPDDPSLKEYWRQRERMKAQTKLVHSRQKIAKKQDYICPVCGEPLLNQEVLQLHHKLPKAMGGDDSYGNLQLVHLYCHQQIHSGAV